MNISEIKRRIIEKLSKQKQPISRFDLMMVVLEPEMNTFRNALVEFVNVGDVVVDIDWQLKLSKILKNNDG